MKFRKKPVVIEAVQWGGNNVQELAIFLDGTPTTREYGIVAGQPINIFTLEGNHRANIRDWIIKGVKGEFYPCKPDIFEQTYEPVGD